MWFCTLNLFILLLFQHFVLNETSSFFAARRLTKQAEFGLKPSIKLKESETLFVHTYSNGTTIKNLAYNVHRNDDDRFQFMLQPSRQPSTLSHPVRLKNNTFIFNENHIGCKVFFRMTGFVRLNFTGKIGFKIHFNESKDDIVLNCAFPLFQSNIHYSYQNCQLTEYFKVFSRMSEVMKKSEKFAKVLLENHFTIHVDDEIESFPISLSFSFIFPYKSDTLFLGENTKVLIKC